MSKQQLWVFVGSADDTLDVLRYVKATESDILGQPAVVAREDKLRAELAALREVAKAAAPLANTIAGGQSCCDCPVGDEECEASEVCVLMERLRVALAALSAPAPSLPASGDADFCRGCGMPMDAAEQIGHEQGCLYNAGVPSPSSPAPPAQCSHRDAFGPVADSEGNCMRCGEAIPAQPSAQAERLCCNCKLWRGRSMAETAICGAMDDVTHGTEGAECGAFKARNAATDGGKGK